MGIDIKGIDKAKLLQGLFNNSRPQGLGFFAAGSNKEMSYGEAQNIVARGELYFDYLQGRVMKIDISGDEMDSWGYDRDNGQGAAQKVVTALRNQNEVQFKKGVPKNEMEMLAEQGKIHEAMDAAPLRIYSL